MLAEVSTYGPFSIGRVVDRCYLENPHTSSPYKVFLILLSQSLARRSHLPGRERAALNLYSGIQLRLASEASGAGLGRALLKWKGKRFFRIGIRDMESMRHAPELEWIKNCKSAVAYQVYESNEWIHECRPIDELRVRIAVRTLQQYMTSGNGIRALVPSADTRLCKSTGSLREVLVTLPPIPQTPILLILSLYAKNHVAGGLGILSQLVRSGQCASVDGLCLLLYGIVKVDLEHGKAGIIDKLVGGLLDIMSTHKPSKDGFSAVMEFCSIRWGIEGLRLWQVREKGHGASGELQGCMKQLKRAMRKGLKGALEWHVDVGRACIDIVKDM